jgi:hypothetical protein
VLEHKPGPLRPPNRWSNGVTADKLFGEVAIDIDYGPGQLGETLLWQG